MNIETQLLRHLIEELLIHEYRQVSAALVQIADPKERFTFVEEINGSYFLWHKHLYVQSSEKREKDRAYMQKQKVLSDRRDDIRDGVRTALDAVIPDDKKFKKLRDAMVNKLMAGKADKLAEALELDLSDIPQLNYWKLWKWNKA